MQFLAVTSYSGNTLQTYHFAFQQKIKDISAYTVEKGIGKESILKCFRNIK